MCKNCVTPLHRRRLHRGNRGMCPGTHKGTGAKITFCPVTFMESTMVLLQRLDCASTSVSGLSVTPSVRRSVRLEMLRGGIHVDVWALGVRRSILFLRFTKCWKETLNPVHSLLHLYIWRTTLTSATKRWNQHQLTSGNCLNCPLKLHTTNDSTVSK